jgi:hypothetical protein
MPMLNEESILDDDGFQLLNARTQLIVMIDQLHIFHLQVLTHNQNVVPVELLPVFEDTINGLVQVSIKSKPVKK